MTFHLAGKYRGTAVAAGTILVASTLCAGAAGLATSVTVESCTTCHGRAGVSQGEMPTIAGQEASQIAEALHGFQDGTRTNTIMERLVGPFSVEDITAISAYFAALPGAGQ